MKLVLHHDNLTGDLHDRMQTEVSTCAVRTVWPPVMQWFRNGDTRQRIHGCQHVVVVNVMENFL